MWAHEYMQLFKWSDIGGQPTCMRSMNTLSRNQKGGAGLKIDLQIKDDKNNEVLTCKSRISAEHNHLKHLMSSSLSSYSVSSDHNILKIFDCSLK